MYRSAIKFTFVIALALLSFSCGQKKVHIGLLLDDFVSDRWERDRDLIIAKAQELESTVITEAAIGDSELQLKQAREMIKQGVDILILVPVDLEASAEIVNYAHKHRVKVISYDRLVSGCDLDYYISYDNVKVGELQALTMLSLAPKGNFVLIGGPNYDNNSVFIKMGQMNILKPAIEKGDIKIIYDISVERWEEEEGYNKMMECIEKNGSNIQAVIAANDNLASGIIKALNEKGLVGKILVAGQDAERDALKLIMTGEQSITISKPIENLASMATQMAVNIARNLKIDSTKLSHINNNFKMVPSMLLIPIVVTKETINLAPDNK